jgi:serine/threonine protein kinase
MSGDTDTLVGATLEGRFRIERLLGEGGMGRVYIADETRLRRRCAVKVLLPELAQDKDNVERFLREAQSIAQIHHENVVDIHHLGEDENFGVVFFAMELLSGEDLEMRLADRKKRPIAWLDVCRWMAQVAGAMGAVHAAGLIHRDLKPSNIFLNRRRDGREQVKLLDFGIAKGFNRSALTGTGAALGTPYYMSPEQILAEQLDPRSDIYSLGVLFFEALAGRMPFIGEPIQVAMQHCNVLPPRPTDVAPGPRHPVELEALVMAMLEKGRDVRMQSMDEVEQRLLMFLPATGSSMITGPLARPLTLPPNSADMLRATFEPPPQQPDLSTAPTGQLPPSRAATLARSRSTSTQRRRGRDQDQHLAHAGAHAAAAAQAPRRGRRRHPAPAHRLHRRCSSGGDETPAQPDPIPVAAQPPTEQPVVTPPVTPPTKQVVPPPPTARPTADTRPATPRTRPTTPPPNPARPTPARPPRRPRSRSTRPSSTRKRRTRSSCSSRPPPRVAARTTRPSRPEDHRALRPRQRRRRQEGHPRRRPTRSASAWPTRSPGPSSRRPAASSSPRRSSSDPRRLRRATRPASSIDARRVPPP